MRIVVYCMHAGVAVIDEVIDSWSVADHVHIRDHTLFIGESHRWEVSIYVGLEDVLGCAENGTVFASLSQA